MLDDLIVRSSNWESVLYPLKMAASLKGLEADTTQGSPPDFGLCEAAASYDAAHSQAASGYVSGLIVFSFVWWAWEATKDMTQFGVALTRGKSNRRAVLSGLTAGLCEHLPGLRTVLDETLDLCQQAGDFADELKKLELIDTSDAQRAADLARRFRNYVFHGDDQVPMPDDWDDEGVAAKKDTPAGILRFYAMSRLVLMLIQLALFSEISNRNAVISVAGPFSEGRPAGEHVVALQLEYCGPEGDQLLLL
ncbi:MAG TPA: hypothetical protein VNZ85_03300 [Caulobacter sp.]|nr:hypothetical protein [Caulobacter sp.]